MIRNFEDLVYSLHQSGKKKRVAVVCPADGHTEYVVKRSLQEGIADFLFINAGRIKPEFEVLCSLYPGCIKTYECDNGDAAARMAVELVRDGAADVLMKGTINTDNLLRAVLNKEHGLLESGRVLSHISVALVPSYGKFTVFSDAAVIPAPTLEQFDSMLRYAIDVCHSLGVECPKAALLHCTEKVSEKFPHTLSYMQLMKRAGEGAYGNVCVCGPMDVKTACDAESGKVKGISSPVVGDADILIFPNIEAGNVFYKTITLFAKADIAGILCGTTAPVVVASRADSNESKYYSLALACSYNSK
ncbi:MAG: phosphate butyryltransferase [Prevotella sp.]|nr:phosphate butyryltransferase [Prevotella sp.]